MEIFDIGRVAGPSPVALNRPPLGPTRYDTPQSFMLSHSCRDRSFSGHGDLPQPAQSYQHYGHSGGVNTPTPMINGNSDFMLPPVRTLPFKSKKRALETELAGPPAQGQERPRRGNGTVILEGESQGNSHFTTNTFHGNEYSNPHKLSRELGHGETAKISCAGETHSSSLFDTHQKEAVDKAEPVERISHRPTKSIQLQDNTSISHGSQVEDIVEFPNPSDTELLSIFRTLDDVVERWRTGFQSGCHVDLAETLSDIQETTQRLHAYLHPNDHESRTAGYNAADDIRGRNAAANSQMVHKPTATMLEGPARTERRRTKEYKQWKEYYLFACRLYETKEERSDPEFIHRFLRGMPGKRALRWVQMGLLHCYPTMVRLSDRRSGTTIVFTKDLKWSHVCDMVTRKLKLPFPKWERVLVR